MADPLREQFIRNWKKKNAAAANVYLLAVSGGMDSMVMADLFFNSGIHFAIAHCNFGLRDQESDLDEQLVENWGLERGIVCHFTKFDTRKSAAEWKMGTQETARNLRYEWFSQLREEHHYSGIVTAHHANDNVETLLINLFKGTGIGGLHGILPENGYIIRPLLFATREMIATYAQANEIPYREDASNARDEYLRNAVRHHIVPVVEQWFPNAVVQINESIGRFAEAEILYEKGLDQERKKLLERRGQDFYLPLLKLRHREPLGTILYELLLPFGFTSAQGPQVIRLMDAESGHFIQSPTHKIIKNRNFFIITANVPAEADVLLVEAVPCTIEAGKYQFSFSITGKPASIPGNKNEAYFDLEAMEFPLVLRKWRTGDYLYPFGMKMKKKKVSRLLIDEKIPLHEKQELRILESGKRIAWISGVRTDERFKVKPGTEKVLVVAVNRKE